MSRGLAALGVEDFDSLPEISDVTYCANSQFADSRAQPTDSRGVGASESSGTALAPSSASG
jgi:hypothetical protein